MKSCIVLGQVTSGKAVVVEFSSRWNFYHTLAAVHEKNMAIRCPKNGRSLYFSCKEFHLNMLFALVDAHYKFIWVDVGTNRSRTDARF